MTMVPGLVSLLELDNVNPDVPRWGYRHRLLHRGIEFFCRPYLPLPGCADNLVQVILWSPMQA
jgi:hypothetical protein